MLRDAEFDEVIAEDRTDQVPINTFNLILLIRSRLFSILIRLFGGSVYASSTAGVGYSREREGCIHQRLL